MHGSFDIFESGCGRAVWKLPHGPEQPCLELLRHRRRTPDAYGEYSAVAVRSPWRLRSGVSNAERGSARGPLAQHPLDLAEAAQSRMVRQAVTFAT
jgi:hypothetical protein